MTVWKHFRWFAQWFGGRHRVEQQTDEPARFAPPRVDCPNRVAARPARVANGAKSHRNKGFDPYNSGAFERRNAWERVGRR